MTAKFFLILISGVLFQNLYSQEGQNAKKWELVWNDEFNFFDTTVWKKLSNFDHYGEPAIYLDENVYTENGRLILAMKAEEYSCPEWMIEPNWSCVHQFKTGEPYKYTSGWVETKAEKDTKFGHIEARISFPYQKAFWPAFWTFQGTNEVNVNAAEIDIVEQLGEKGVNTLTTNIHTDYCTPDKESYSNGCPEIGDFFKSFSIKKYDWTDWHVYGVDWDEKRIRFYLDGKRIRTIKKHGIVDPVKVILNFGLRPEIEVDDSLLPQNMQVDYVRIYKLKE